MRKQTVFIVFALMMGAGLSLFFGLRFKWYPVAFVNLQPVGARLLEQQTHAAQQYYEKAALTYVKEKPANEAAVTAEIRRAVLDKLIENVIIADELARRLGPRASEEVKKKVEALDYKTGEVAEAVRELYGLTVEQFRSMVLVPQAEREVLAEDMASDQEKITITEWLLKARASAKVNIIAHLFFWNGKQVEFKKVEAK